ncbi:MAG: prephenate dehydratase [Streptosporangiales bacterium]|nr:prephenate dehydratase [Streptosporangiales bacterium]
MPVTYAYLGPEGTFTEAALRAMPGAANATRVPFTGVPAVFDALRAGTADAAMVPLENSVEGGVPATMDELIGGEGLLITAEVFIPVEFALLVRPGTDMTAIKRVITHPHAQAQCRRWLARELPEAEVLAASSTAAAAMAVAEPGAIYEAAIAAPIAGEHYGLRALVRGIGDRADAVTRFVFVERGGARPPESTAADRTSLVAYIADDHPGALLEILREFSVRGVNLTRIESRPTGDGLGRYCFCIDAEGHVADARVGEALMGLRRVCADVKFLGSYPRADGRQAEVRRGTADHDFTHAQDWLERIRGGA